ncbi:alpha/beta hydrolase [Actinoplanes sp. NPDC051494]|uniref:alpha/beta hydrolase n=1 Tax=Actinoplanes sp. NPDC051494 TaxID=3363907 RepID=UPI0037A668B1
MIDHAPTEPDITVYPADPSFTGPRPAILVFPGGGYRTHPGHDGEGYARWLSGIGLHAFVVRYPLLTAYRFPAPLESGRQALDRVRSGDHGLDVDPGRVGVIGSSAGGHLAALLATGTVLSIEDLPEPPPRPDFAVLAYSLADLRLLPEAPVSFVLDGRTELRDELSPGLHIDSETCPAFLWATAGDQPGFVNTMAMANAYFTAGIPVELHIYPRGGHGVGLADGVAYGEYGHADIPHTAQWTRACAAWLRDSGFLTP